MLVYSFVKVERNIEESVRVAHIHLQPVDWRLQLNLDALANHRHLRLSDFDHLRLHVLTEQGRELIHEYFTHSQRQLLLLPLHEHRVQLRHNCPV